MNAFLQHFLFEFKTGIRNKQLLLMNYLFPLGFFLLMGFIMPAINPPFRDDLIPALVVFAILAATLLGIPDPLVYARDSGIFRSYRINGIPSLTILMIPTLTALLHLVITAAIITLTSPLLFKSPPPTNWLNYVVVFIALAVANTGISVLIGVISSSSRMTVLWSQILFIPSMLLGGMMIPNSLLPDAIGKLSRLLPATLAMNAFKGLAFDRVADFSAWGSVLILLVGGLIAVCLAVYLFSWDNRNPARRGKTWLALLVLLPFIAGVFLL